MRCLLANRASARPPCLLGRLLRKVSGYGGLEVTIVATTPVTLRPDGTEAGPLWRRGHTVPRCRQPKGCAPKDGAGLCCTAEGGVPL